jgi:hypothetical protein
MRMFVSKENEQNIQLTSGVGNSRCTDDNADSRCFCFMLYDHLSFKPQHTLVPDLKCSYRSRLCGHRPSLRPFLITIFGLCTFKEGRLCTTMVFTLSDSPIDRRVTRVLVTLQNSEKERESAKRKSWHHITHRCSSLFDHSVHSPCRHLTSPLQPSLYLSRVTNDTMRTIQALKPSRRISHAIQGSSWLSKRSSHAVADSQLQSPSVKLYQYQICPFCNKVKAVLGYAGIDHEIVEVNPLTKAELKW